jgi:nicotinamide riboside kinase
MNTARVVALLGAESTGKTTLATELQAALQARGHSVAMVPEYLREFCDRHRRTPRQDEQRAIAAEQTRRIDAAARDHAIVVADTTALMIAVYSEQVFGDTGLYAAALADHARCSLTLLTALDLPWLPDGLQRDGPQVREPVDAKVRAALARAGLPYAVIFGRGDERLRAALACVQRALDLPPPAPAALQAQGQKEAQSPSRGQTRWQWFCERCGDADCERHRLPHG